MATRHGYEYGNELVTKHGWAWDTTDRGDDYCGDQNVVDPLTGQIMTPYQGRELQAKRDAEAKDTKKHS